MPVTRLLNPKRLLDVARKVWRAGKWFRLPLEERRLMLRALPLVALVRLGLSVLPYRVVRKVAARLAPQAGSGCDDALTPREIATLMQGIERASRLIPKASCLTQAITAQVMLARRGQAARLQIGVARGEEARFEAHAWIECQSRIIIGGLGRGGIETQRFTPLASFDAL